MRAAAVIVLVLASGCWFGEAPPPEVDRPNIVLIIGDDHGYPDFGFMGSPYVETPQLDRLAEGGTVFTHGYNTASVCVPSLRTLLTGFYPHQFTARRRVLQRLGVRRSRLEWIQVFATLPRQLARRGYASFQAGKYWEGDYASGGFTDGMVESGNPLRSRAQSSRLGRELPLDAVYEFIDAQAERPFFLWFAPMLPHVPHDASEEYRSRYTGRGLVTPAVRYYANITRFDDLVGELISHLEERGLRERTLVVYLADNGWEQKPHEVPPGILGGARGKGSMYEMGMRTPIVFSWPGVVPGGVMSDALVSTVDLFPTLLDYAGAPQRRERPGRSLRPLIQQGKAWLRDCVIGLGVQWHPAEGPASEPEPEKSEFEQFAAEFEEPAAELEEPAPSRSRRLRAEPTYFLRDRQWWYIWNRRRDVDRLYDAESDPYDERDLAPEHPELVAQLRARVLAWEAETRRFLRPPRQRLGKEGPEASP